MLLRVVSPHAEVSERERAAAYLENVAGRMAGGAFEVTTDVRHGAAASAILDTARQQGADLIALTAHGHGGFMELLLGSTADKIVRGAGTPVLLMRGGS